MGQSSQTRPECFSSTFAEILFVLAATMSCAMTSWLGGGLTVVTAKIGDSLHMDNAQITWATAASSLTTGAFLLFFGRLADLFGRKQMMVVSLFLYAVFCLAAGFVKDGITFDIIQGLLGFCSAASIPAAVGALGSVYSRPSKRKNYAFACFSAGNPVGFVCGTFACGVATTILSWRAYFFFLAIVYLFFSVAAFFVVPRDTDEKQPWTWQTFKNFDIGGSILVMGGFGLLSTALTLAGSAPDGWKTPYVIALLVVGVVLVPVFLYYETLVPDPLVPMWIWKDIDFSLQLLILFMGAGSFTAASFWITLYMQRFWTNSSILIAVYNLPMVIMGITANIVAGVVLHKVSNKLLIMFGCVAYTISFLLLSLNRTGDIYWAFVFPSFCLCVWGADFQFNVVNMYVMTSLPAKQQSTGGGIFQTVSKLSQAIILGITTAIFNAVQAHPPTTGYVGNDPIAPYSATFYFSTAICFASLLLCPFLKIGTQGGQSADDAEAIAASGNPGVIAQSDVGEKQATTIVARESE